MAPRSKSKHSAQPTNIQPAPVQRAPVQRAPVQRTPVLPAPVEEENINLDNVSSASEDEDEDAPPAPAEARVTPARGANAPGDEATRVAPIIKPVVKSHRALDIDLLFDRGKGKPSVCKYCKWVSEYLLYNSMIWYILTGMRLKQTLQVSR